MQMWRKCSVTWRCSRKGRRLSCVSAKPLFDAACPLPITLHGGTAAEANRTTISSKQPRVGLVNAVNRFELTNGADFASFAVPTIIGEVRRHFRDYGWAVKVPRRMKELRAQLTSARGELSQQLGRAPNASEIAEHLGIDREWVIEATIAGANYSTLSTDRRPGPDDEFHSIGDTFGDVDPGLDKVLDVETARPLIAALPEQQRTVLTLRFFEDMTQSQIAERMGYSQMHISRLLAKALDTLRNQVREPHLAVTA